MSRQVAMSRRRTARTMSRRTLGILTALAVAALIVVLIASEVNHAVSKLGLPLTNAAVIRKQAAEKRLDPALIAAVIYAESKFAPRQSSAGAEGLMQILPETAYFIAHLSGGSAVHGERPGDAEHQRRLRQLLPALPARPLRRQRDARRRRLQRRPGERRPLGRARAREGGHLTVAAIPFPETRAYVERVLGAQQDYRDAYARELGLH